MMKKLTTEEFIEKAKLLYGNKYDYSLVEYINSQTKVKIIFDGIIYEQRPNKHLCGRCPEKDTKSKTTEEFIKNAIIKHGDKYNYSLVEYKNNKTKVKIILNGIIYKQLPNPHINGSLPEMANLQKNNTEFIKDAKNIHGEKYDYSLVDYKNSYTKIKIILNGKIYEQKPNKHLIGKCPEKLNKLKTSNEFIKDAKSIHGDKYDYSLVKYIGNLTPIKIIFKGKIYEQLPSTHLKGYTPENRNARKSKNQIINEFKSIHDDKYDYSLIEYKNSKTKVKIICKKHNKYFEQIPSSHLNGSGCPWCNDSKANDIIEEYLKSKFIEYTREKTFEDCINIRKLPFDFYLPINNTIIEFDGKQHFEPIEFFGGEESFKNRVKNDEIKNNYCEENKIRLIRINYKEFSKINDILENSSL